MFSSEMRANFKMHCLILPVRCVDNPLSAAAKRAGPEGKFYPLYFLSKAKSPYQRARVN